MGGHGGLAVELQVVDGQVAELGIVYSAESVTDPWVGVLEIRRVDPALAGVGSD